MANDEACWPYVSSNDARHPVLGLVVKGPLRADPHEALVRIDTGYEGFLLLNEEKYRRLGLHLAELPRRYWPEGETVTGESFRLRRAWAIIRIRKFHTKFEGHVDTFRGNTEDLVGLELLESLRLLLDGPAHRACLTR